MYSFFQKRYIKFSILLIVVCLAYQNCSQNGSKFIVANSSVPVGGSYIDNNGNGVDDSSEIPPAQTSEGGGNSEGPILQKTSQYKMCNLSENQEPYKFSDLIEFGGIIDLPGFRFVQYDILDKSQTNYALKRINTTLRDFLKIGFDRAGLKNSDFVAMVVGDIYNKQTGLFQPVSQENISVIRSALTLHQNETGTGNLLPLPGFFTAIDVITDPKGNQTSLQQELENFVGNLRFSHITSVMPHLIGHVLLYTEFLDVPKSIAMRAKNKNQTLNTNKTIEMPSHKTCYLPQYDGSILERTIDLNLGKDKVIAWRDGEKAGTSFYGRRVEPCFHDETKKCISDNWLHRPNGFSDRIYNIEIQ